MAIANGTEMSSGSRVAFYQYDFDLLCSDLIPSFTRSSRSIRRVGSPLTCGYEYPPWVNDLLSLEEHLRPAGRALERYKAMNMLRGSEELSFIHLVDGGEEESPPQFRRSVPAVIRCTDRALLL